MKRLATAVLISALALLPCGAAAKAATPYSINDAEKAISELPYPLTFTHPPRDTQNSLVIGITDKLGQSFRFFLFLGHPPLRLGVPGYHREQLVLRDLGGHFWLLANPRRQTRKEAIFQTVARTRPKVTKAMEEEFLAIELAVQNAVCSLVSGKPCSPF